MKQVVINRYKVTSNYSLGHCYIVHTDGIVEYIGCSLERGWRDNQKNVSCVPEGEYDLKLEWSPRFKKELWELYGVPGRSETKFHVSNYWQQLEGCIALGRKHKDINKDGDPDVTSSRDVMREFHEKMSGQSQSKVKIRNVKF